MKTREYILRDYCHHVGIGVSLGRRLRSLLWHRRNKEEGLPDDSVVKGLPVRAEDMSSVPRHRREIPHAVEQLSLCATSIEPAP